MRGDVNLKFMGCWSESIQIDSEFSLKAPFFCSVPPIISHSLSYKLKVNLQMKTMRNGEVATYDLPLTYSFMVGAPSGAGVGPSRNGSCSNQLRWAMVVFYIYANLTGVYWWDPRSTIYSSTVRILWDMPMWFYRYQRRLSNLWHLSLSNSRRGVVVWIYMRDLWTPPTVQDFADIYQAKQWTCQVFLNIARAFVARMSLLQTPTYNII